jgi:hypothetical protein
MTHLTDIEFVDLLDGGYEAGQPQAAAPALPADRLRHLETCEPCRTRWQALRASIDEARSDEAPEPSPLFWDFFAARVADAIRHESPAGVAPAPRTWEWRRHQLAQWAIAASIATLVMMAVVWRATLQAPDPPGSSSAVRIAAGRAEGAGVGASAPGGLIPDDVEKDAAWAVVRTAAEGLRWEDAHAAGITAGPGAAEGLALELTNDERAELARLIDTEMKRRGA